MIEGAFSDDPSDPSSGSSFRASSGRTPFRSPSGGAAVLLEGLADPGPVARGDGDLAVGGQSGAGVPVDRLLRAVPLAGGAAGRVRHAPGSDRDRAADAARGARWHPVPELS